VGDCSVLQKIFSALILFNLSSQVIAHEFWLEPINFEIKVNDKLRAHEKVGQDFKGNKYSYLSSSYKYLNLTIGEKTRAIKSRLGDLPAVSELVKEEGLAILSAVTTPSTVTYETWEKFSNFIKSKELDWVIDAHKKRNLTEKNFKESYRRYGKSLVKVGHGEGSDHVLGLLFEWIVETNPYTSEGTAIKAQLLWMGKPHVNSHVSVFNRIGDELIKTHLTTDSQGRVEVPRAKGGRFMINAVQMIEASEGIIKETGAVWDSRWASVTYELKPK
jgi:uncharacterized GH25 family protein